MSTIYIYEATTYHWVSEPWVGCQAQRELIFLAKIKGGNIWWEAAINWVSEAVLTGSYLFVKTKRGNKLRQHIGYIWRQHIGCLSRRLWAATYWEEEVVRPTRAAGQLGQPPCIGPCEAHPLGTGEIGRISQLILQHTMWFTHTTYTICFLVEWKINWGNLPAVGRVRRITPMDGMG